MCDSISNLSDSGSSGDGAGYCESPSASDTSSPSSNSNSCINNGIESGSHDSSSANSNGSEHGESRRENDIPGVNTAGILCSVLDLYSGTFQTTAFQEDTDGVIARQPDISEWIAKNANAKESFLFIDYDDNGGEKVSRALNGDSSLGSLTPSEQRFLIDAAVKEWSQTGNTENIREAAENLKNPETKEIVAEVYAGVSAADERIYAQGGTILITEAAQTAKAEMLRTAIDLDPVAVIDSFAGVEGSLGKLAANMDLEPSLVEAVADGKVDPTGDGVSKMVTAMFLKSGREIATINRYRDNMAGALAQIMVNRDGQTDAALQNHIAALQNRYDAILASPGGADLLLNDKVAPQLRGWAVIEIASNPSLDAQALEAGWESEAISSAYAAPIIDRYQARGIEPQTLTGESLRNTIGQALGVAPTRLPGADESAADEQNRLDAGLDYQYYGPNPCIDAIAKKITALGGDNAQVSIMPVTVSSNEFGAATFNVFKVQGKDGTPYFIEDVDPSRHYEGFEDWHANSHLPPGEMTYVSNMEWGPSDSCPQLITGNTPQVVDTIGEWAREIGDGVALGAGIVAGTALILGTGGMGALVVAGAAGAYTTARAGENLYEAHSHGVDITDMSNPEVRANWIDAAAGTLSFGAMGAAKLATLARGTRFASTAANSAAGLQLAANTADAAAATNQAYDLATNWSELDNAQRATGLLNIAFWGGMTAASAHAGGGHITDAYSFTRLRNNIEFGSPYPVSRNSELQPGEMRIVYDTGENGSATHIHIEHGGGDPNPDMLDLHSRTARQMEASGNLLDRIRTQFTGGAPAEVGSAAWEAQFELNKVNSEAQSIGNRLADPNLNPTERARLESRLSELETETAYQIERLDQLDQLEQRGEGWIASPTKGEEQARKLGWINDEIKTPEGYTWVAGPNEPHLRRLDPDNSKPLYFDPTTRTFVEAADKPSNVHIGHGENDVQWTTNDKGQTIEVDATLREFYTNAERSYEEVKMQGEVGSNGRTGDEGGHIIGHRFVLDEGLKNMFPQDAHLNRGAYKTLENEMADWIHAGVDVHVKVKLDNFQNGRPTEIDISYQVVDPHSGKQVFKSKALFDNDTNQSYNRVEKTAMEAMIAEAKGV
ncbi:MAG: DUF4781 domain-containing protein [Desulfosarcinaceae bacterium]